MPQMKTHHSPVFAPFFTIQGVNKINVLDVNQVDGTAVFDVDTVNRKIVVTSGTTGQSTIGAGLIVNNDSGSGAINDFQVNSDTLTAILVDASADTMTIGVPIGDLTMTGDLTIPDDGLFGATNTANYFWMGDGTNYNPVTPAAAVTGLGLDAGGAGDIWVEKAGDTMTGELEVPGILVTDKIKLTQTDGNEYIDSLADGYLDLAATTGIRLRGIDDTADPRLTFVSGNDGYIEWQEDELQFHIEGGLEISLGLNMTGSFFPKAVDDDAMDATDGVEGEIVYNQDDNKFYGCTTTGTPATWAAFH